ncbi:hypothetical protein EYZ11_000647 [Aspergillus tanneri]|uniref:RING-type domain-containing protein n=1 Tax=Aspergillus tanneri TaxID=1220188 RepID=A0A4S3JWJ8_9EURO|nr:hypothetical protein EYZ11_000647 [Aspergillus tanneri]
MWYLYQTTCLTSWFAGGRSNKTCPDCRAPVKSEPSPAYLVRAVVQLFTSRAELLDKGETTAEHIRHQRDEAEKVERDKKNTHHKDGGLFRGIFNKARLSIPAPVVDLEDNVIRCPVCSWELEEESGCAQCGYRRDEGSTTSSSDYMSELDENSDMTDYLDDDDVFEDGFGEVDDFDLNALYHGAPPNGLPFNITQQLYGLLPNLQNRHGPLNGPYHVPSDDWDQHDAMSSIPDSEDEEDSEDTDMDSFIDDDEHFGGMHDYDSDLESDRSTVVGPEYNTQARYEEVLEHSDIPTSQLGDLISDGSVDISSTDYGSEDIDDDDDDDDDEPIRPPVNGGRRCPVPFYQELLSSPGQSQLQNTNFDLANPRSIPQAQRPHTTGTTASDAISLEDDSDEGPVRPSRRAKDGRNRRTTAL